MKDEKMFFNHARTLISHIEAFISDCVEVEDYCRAIKRYNKTYHTSFKVASGLTRVAIIAPHDFVIKINYGEEAYLYGDCDSECYLYNIAKEDGYEYLLAEIVPYSYHGRKYYIMPFIHGVETSIHSIEYFLEEDEIDWLDQHVTDLHSGNFGFDDYGNPVIVDYACLRSMII